MKYPGVGTGVYIAKDGKILLGRRIGKNGTGMWCVPGGKVELYENWLDNAVREVREEAGIEVANVRLMAVTDDQTPQIGTHFVTLHLRADWIAGEPRDEEGKLTDWTWCSWAALPQPLFWPTQNFVNLGINPLEFRG